MNSSLIAKFNITTANTTITLYNINATFIDWGDGTVASGGLTHTYANVGEYECSMQNTTVVGEGAFNGCKALTSVTIPGSVTTIENGAFYNCTSLTSMTIGNGVVTIGESAFENCKALTSATIPNSVTTIEYGAFSGCNSLAIVTIGHGVTSIGESAFYGCKALKTAIIGNSVTTIGFSAFEDCTSLASVTIPDSVTTIGQQAFSSCTSLTSVTIGNNVTTIESSAFYDCNSLISITIPDSVTTIRNGAFHYCSSLASVTIGNSITSIGDSAFSYCPLKTVECLNSTNPPLIYDGTFPSTATTYVPSNILEQYKTSWNAVIPDLTILPIKYVALHSLGEYHRQLKVNYLDELKQNLLVVTAEWNDEDKCITSHTSKQIFDYVHSGGAVVLRVDDILYHLFHTGEQSAIFFSVDDGYMCTLCEIENMNECTFREEQLAL